MEPRLRRKPVFPKQLARNHHVADRGGSGAWQFTVTEKRPLVELLRARRKRSYRSNTVQCGGRGEVICSAGPPSRGTDAVPLLEAPAAVPRVAGCLCRAFSPPFALRL